jgi:hypothetical protein
MKLTTVKSGLNDISCMCVITDDLIAVGGRFSSFVEVYRVGIDRGLVGKIDTKTTQGV